jgi:ribosomal-protein-alanine N-acetyltransferase
VGKAPAVTIERMRKEDLDQVMAIEQTSFSQPWSRNLFLSEFRNPSVSLMLVARSPGPERYVQGYIVCWVFVDELHILVLATRHDARRRGIARRLVCSALAEGYRRGARKAYLEVRESNHAGMALYGGLGFGQAQVRRDYYDGPVENAVVMMLDTEGLRLCIGAVTGGSA